MRHKLGSAKAALGSLTPVNTESRSSSSIERSGTIDYRENLAFLEEDWSNSSQQLLGTPSSFSSSILLDMCRCCGRADCENLEYFTRKMKKLESDTRLAAEIGQGLLHKHETYVAESNQQKVQLEKQLDECHEKINGLEQSLDEVENAKDAISKEKNKWLWEYQKRQKILDETISDLEMANEKSCQLSAELKARSTELEKLRLFKFMVRHSESREEALTSKLEDTKQELVICRKNELVLESHIKKLKMKYESLYHSHEQLTRNIEETALLVNNNSSRTNTTKHVSSNNLNNNNNDLINLIKELLSANTKLKADLMSCKDQLSEARGEVTALTQKMEDKTENISLYNEMKPKPKKKRAKSVKEHPKKPMPSKSKTIQPPMPTISSSMPTSSLGTSPGSNAIVHHHYHYYVKNSKGEHIPISDAIGSMSLDDCTLEKKLIDEDGQHSNEDDEVLVLSPSTSSVITIKDGAVATTASGLTKSPFSLLQEHVTQLLDRLRCSDIRALNRRLKRAFDITELSSMSNSIIENIVMDVDNLENRFLWVKTTSQTEEDFFPLVVLFKSILKELGILKSTMNELQAEYVKKIEANEQRVEEEIIKKRQLKRQQQTNQTSANPNSANDAGVTNVTPLTSWFTNIFSHKEANTTTASTAPIGSKNSNSNALDVGITNNNHHYHDKGSTLTKTTTNSSTLILSNDDDDHSTLRSRIIPEEEAQPLPTTSSNCHHHPHHYARTFPRQSMEKRRQIPYFPPPHSASNQPLILTSSQSTGTNRSSPSIPIRNNNAKRNLHHRMNIDYEGIGPATIRPIPSDSDATTTFSSSWLGGK